MDTELEPGELEYVVRKFHDADTMHSYLSEKDGHNLLIRLSLPSTYIRSRRMPRSHNSLWPIRVFVRTGSRPIKIPTV